MVEVEEFLHLAVVRAGIGINHLLGRVSQVYFLSQIIKHHVAVEHLRVTVQAFFREAIIVIPRFYLSYHFVDVTL